ncbi:hypothetical protein [Mesoterricola silvestris]|uniref:Tetratricopeptide repeat protein n=1 Tax=Mesoterricola silvestris TaxID=2927979 RepID=A0AA48GMS3_9BACT|nr:hypothetical protein [Mesoterricola silvestris]BDU74199.1 hypothetical protein METEAL_33730 [Mesoterricola silvestris]
MRSKRAFAWILPLAAVGFAASVIPWESMTEGDWIYALATRFATVDGHRVHYPTPTAELARLLEGRGDPGALRHLAEARLSLGDRKGALEAMERWAQASGPAAWAETARWEAAHSEPAAAFKAAERALPGLDPEELRALCDERVEWAQAHPDLADAIALRRAKAERFPDDAEALEAWLRALEKAGRLDEADQGLAASHALPPERRLLVRSDLKADHGDARGAFLILDGAVTQPWSSTFERAYARRVDQAAGTAPGAWRATLETRFDAGALARLHAYLNGKRQAGLATELLRQVERRHEKGLDRNGELLLSRLYASVDAVPEAFRAGLAAAHLGTPDQQTGDLALLAHLALRAGGRPLAWGAYNDEAYRWVAAVDRTPGLWTGGVSFLLTGVPWKETLDNLEFQALPDRTFATARALADALAQRAPKDPALPALRVAIMARHVERGEGAKALALLPLVEGGPAAQADEARNQALLAARQVEVPLAEELRLMKARMRYAAPDRSRPTLQGREEGGYQPEEPDASRAWARLESGKPRARGYYRLLDDFSARLDQRDGSHRASVDLILAELDRLPDAEELWMNLASRLESWNLDDGLGPRYQEALKRFQDPGIWDKAARWYARRNYHAELRTLAADVTARFRGSELFRRSNTHVTVQVPDQPPVGGGVRMVLWADWVRLKALERFPHSPLVFREAGRLVTPAQWQKDFDPAAESKRTFTKVIVPEGLLEERRWAILFADPAQREAWFASAMKQGTLETRLAALEGRRDRTPVEDLLLFEGWARLSRFERAVAPGESLCRSYPGDGDFAQRLLSLHRSLNGLEASHGAPARALVERAAPALENPNPLWTELGEMEEDRGRGAEAMVIWRNLLARSPRDPARISELATLLWDYNHDREALDVVEAGRKALGRPRFYAFETGVLRENLKDLDGAVREYLDATRPEEEGYDSSFENDQRSLRRLAQLLARPRVYALVEKRIRALAPGNAEDERTLAAFFPLGSITPPDPGLTWDADTWIDAMDQPNDPVGREKRQAAKEARRPAEHDAIARIEALMLDKLNEMIPRATAAGFLDFAGQQGVWRIGERWPKARAKAFEGALMARRAELAPEEEERIRLEMDRARFLADNGRGQEADAVWAALEPRIGKLPEGSVKLRAESQRAGYLERTKGAAVAAADWRRITARYPWSLGLLDDRLAFLDRAKLPVEALDLLEQTVPRAAAGHRENLLQRLTQASLAASDLKRARRAVEQILASPALEDPRRLAAVHLLARLSFREDPAWDPFPVAKAQTPLLKPEGVADLYHELARAADLENAPARGVALWIEALNRRTERAWLVAASRSTQRGGKGPEFLAFFEKQHERSPRDMRWAVAVRDIKRFFHDVDGAVAAAKAAVTVRPEQEILWRDAADILERADRLHEAADYLEGWNRPRPASEDVAKWRSELYARAGDPARALAVEQDTLKALAREGSADPQETRQRRARAAQRLFHRGLPAMAVRLYSAKGDIGPLAADGEVPLETRVQIGLLTGQITRVLAVIKDNPQLLPQAAAAFAGHAKPEQKEEVQAWLQRLLQPKESPAPDSRALDAWWPFIANSGLETGLREGLAQRLLASRGGPWFVDPPYPFVHQVGENLVGETPATAGRPAMKTFREPDLAALWVRDLARRDRAEELLAFVEPRWQELLGQVRGAANVGSTSSRQAWTWWLDDRTVLETWARAAAAQPGKVKDLSDVMADRRLWDRFWVLGARGWSADTLVAILPEAPRTAWFRFWAPAPSSDPVLQARRGVVERVDAAMARLVQGAAGAADDPLIDKLRGPRTVGDVLGKDPRWIWPEFIPRRDGRGDLAEKGDDRVAGQGVDQGRVPGALWGERPGEAWYVLEALARYRKGDPTAPYLPLESPQRGAETARALLAMRLARALGDLPLALRVAEGRPGPVKDRAWVEGKLSLLAAADRKQEAADAFRAYVKAIQSGLTDADFQDLTVLSTRLGLPGPLECLDASRPVGPVFLAYLQDQRTEAARAFHTANPVDFRTALHRRWAGREAQLTRAQAQYWLRELWATGTAPLPPVVLAKIGPVWPSAWAHLGRIVTPERPGAIAALEKALDPANHAPALLAELVRPDADDASRLLAVRIHLSRNELEPALAQVDAMLAETGRIGNLVFDMTPAPEDTEGGEATNEAPAQRPDPMGRLEGWLVPFKAVGRQKPVEERYLKFLAGQRREGEVPPASWRLAFRLTPAAEAPALAREFEEAWFRGEVAPWSLGEILETAAPVVPLEARRWLSRMIDSHTYFQARQRAGILEKLKLRAEAAASLLASRRTDAWTAREDAMAFDVWRRLTSPGAKAPEYWTGAAAVWTGPVSLGDRLKAHGHDVLAARAALRSLAPGDENALARVQRVLENDRPWARDLDGDRALLRLRASRSLLPRSAAAAQHALGPVDPEALARILAARHFKAADINAALGDVARISARAGREALTRRTLAVLADRNAAGLKALQAELAPAAGRAEAFRMEGGRPAPIRPRDLTWALLTNVLNKEGRP